MTETMQTRSEDIPDRTHAVAYADLVRTAEPGDHVLMAAIVHHGVERTRALLDVPEGPAVVALHDACEAVGLEKTTAVLSTALTRWRGRVAELDGERDLRVMDRIGAHLVVPGSPGWPGGLDELGLDRPVALWSRGTPDPARLLDGSVAVVGARASTPYGDHVAADLSHGLVRAGRTVASGGAYGIDAAAHRAAASAASGVGADGAAGPGTVAFMAGGVDRYYPRENAELLDHVARNWAVVSEAPPGGSAHRHRFLMRNRLIAAVASATVVVQAGWRSGALNTANRAAELMRPVAAVPGAVTSAESAGCHRLIREGVAVLVTGPEDVLELVGPLDAARAEPGETQAELRLTDDMSAQELRVYESLPRRRGTDVDGLARRAGLDVPATMSALAGLHLRGHAEKVPSGWVKTIG
ncbi:DNA-processing protein DprA [Brevibacterium litoralis]|uniref:DNA-processing protein DprA n=1 Tax=Brevibacterium litoralis TaxID=3138935 RepID=UPI0032EB8A52